MGGPDLDALADLLALRDAEGRACGMFSDHGSWLAACWGETGELVTLYDTSQVPERAVFTLGTPEAAVAQRAFPDRLEIDLAGGAQLQLGYAGRETLFLRCPDDLPLRVARADDGPYHRRVAGGWAIGLNATAPVAADCLERNRARWEGWLRRCAAALPAGAGARETRLFLRALVTLAWNRRGPLGEMRTGAVLPTCFGYPGYWAGESWRIAHALAPLDAELALDQLRVQFSRQAGDGMVADTVRGDHGDENWRNTKPARAAWALSAVDQAGGAAGAVRALVKPCARQVEWWQVLRRQDHDVLFRPGGADRLAATWDTGWDESLRFEGASMSKRTPWRLLDLWPVDVNATHLMELRALQQLAARYGEPALHDDLRRRARALEAALDDCFDADAGLFLDRAPDATSAGWRPRVSLAAAYPVWAGLGGEAARAGLARALTDPERFATPLPFPSLAADEEGFDPQGRWNGSVYPEHAVVALLALGLGGAAEPAAAEPLRALRERLLDGLDRYPALYECYDPRDGAPVQGATPAFAQASACAAALLELLLA